MKLKIWSEDGKIHLTKSQSSFKSQKVKHHIDVYGNPTSTKDTQACDSFWCSVNDSLKR